MKKVNVRVGDVFSIPIDANRLGYGQLVLQPDEDTLFICVFSATTSPGDTRDLREIVRSDILLAGSTFDAKLNHGHWAIVGNVTENLSQIALPIYKYGFGDGAMVESLDRSRQRRATQEEENTLPFRTYTAPVGFELAIKAVNGVGEWLEYFDNLKYDQLRKSSTVVI